MGLAETQHTTLAGILDNLAIPHVKEHLARQSSGLSETQHKALRESWTILPSWSGLKNPVGGTAGSSRCLMLWTLHHLLNGVMIVFITRSIEAAVAAAVAAAVSRCNWACLYMHDHNSDREVHSCIIYPSIKVQLCTICIPIEPESLLDLCHVINTDLPMLAVACHMLTHDNTCPCALILLRNPELTEFVIATIPTYLAVNESGRLLSALRKDNIPCKRIVVNQACNLHNLRPRVACMVTYGPE